MIMSSVIRHFDKKTEMCIVSMVENKIKIKHWNMWNRKTHDITELQNTIAVSSNKNEINKISKKADRVSISQDAYASNSKATRTLHEVQW